MAQKFLGFAISIIFIALIVTTAWYALATIDQKTRIRTRDALQTVLLSTQETLHIWVNQRKLDTLELARNDTLIRLTRDLINEKHKSESKEYQSVLALIRNFMRPKLSRYGDRDFFIIFTDKKNIASMRNTNIGKQNLIQTQRKEYLANAFEGETMFIPTIHSDIRLTNDSNLSNENEPSIFIASPLNDFDGKLLAVLAIQINLNRQFTRITQLGRLGQTGETYAFDEKATLISESRFDDQLRRIGLVATDSRGILSIRVADPGGNLLKGYKAKQTTDEMPLTKMAKNAKNGVSASDTSGYRDYRGVEVFGARLWDKELGFGLTTEIDAEEAMQPFYETRIAIGIIVLLTVILWLVFSIIHYRNFNKPI